MQNKLLKYKNKNKTSKRILLIFSLSILLSLLLSSCKLAKLEAQAEKNKNRLVGVVLTEKTLTELVPDYKEGDKVYGKRIENIDGEYKYSFDIEDYCILYNSIHDIEHKEDTYEDVINEGFENVLNYYSMKELDIKSDLYLRLIKFMDDEHSHYGWGWTEYFSDSDLFDYLANSKDERSSIIISKLYEDSDGQPYIVCSNIFRFLFRNSESGLGIEISDDDKIALDDDAEKNIIVHINFKATLPTKYYKIIQFDNHGEIIKEDTYQIEDKIAEKIKVSDDVDYILFEEYKDEVYTDKFDYYMEDEYAIEDENKKTGEAKIEKSTSSKNSSDKKTKTFSKEIIKRKIINRGDYSTQTVFKENEGNIILEGIHFSFDWGEEK